MAIPLCLAPFLFNPHQFKMAQFILDYAQLLAWFTRGNGSETGESWINYHRSQRSQMVGHKSQGVKGSGEKISKPKIVVIVFQEVLVPLITAAIVLALYGISDRSIFAVMRVAGIALAPVAINMVVLLVLFAVSVSLGPVIGCCSKNGFGAFIAGIAHSIAVISCLGAAAGIALLADFQLNRTLLGLIGMMFLQRSVFRVLIVLFVTREHAHDGANKAWWTGLWWGHSFGWTAFIQPFREFICKVCVSDSLLSLLLYHTVNNEANLPPLCKRPRQICEMSSFAMDFIFAHLILFMIFPACLIPGIDRYHTLGLLWMTPTDLKIRHGGKVKNSRVMTKTQKRTRNWTLAWSTVLFVSLLIAFLGVVIVPQVTKLPVSSKMIPG